MLFVVNGTTIAKAANKVVVNNDNSFTQVMFNGVAIWFNRASYTVTSSVTLTAGVHFPHDTNVSYCMVGGGGSGACDSATAGGGYSGAVKSGVINKPKGSTISITIGAGGGVVAPYAAGKAGGSTVLDGITAAGGHGGYKGSSSHAGNGQNRSTCGGTGKNGSHNTYGNTNGYGGQSSGFSNGGNSRAVYSAYAGGVGSGGGGANYTNSSYRSGAGGRGQVNLSW